MRPHSRKPQKILVDSNVVVDLLQLRDPFLDDALAIFEAAIRDAVLLVVTVKQVSDIHYLMSSSLHSKEEASQLLRKLLKIVVVVDAAASDVDVSLARGYADFEDGLLMAAAERLKLDAIVTRDATGFRDSPVPVLSPAEFVQQL